MFDKVKAAFFAAVFSAGAVLAAGLSGLDWASVVSGMPGGDSVHAMIVSGVVAAVPALAAYFKREAAYYGAEDPGAPAVNGAVLPDSSEVQPVEIPAIDPAADAAP